MDKKERLLKLIEHFSNGNKTSFATMIGVSPQGLSTWLTRETFDIERIYSKCENINADWLLTGRGEMLKSDADEPQPPLVTNNPALGAPYYDVDFIGGFDEVFNSQVSVPFTNIIIRGFEKAQLWCNVTGHSMEPEINHGDIIGLHECAVSDIQYGEIYAVVLDTLRTIKILRKSSDPHSLRFVPINTTDYDEQDFPISRIIKVYEVIGSVKKFF